MRWKTLKQLKEKRHKKKQRGHRKKDKDPQTAFQNYVSEAKKKKKGKILWNAQRKIKLFT